MDDERDSLLNASGGAASTSQMTALSGSGGSVQAGNASSAGVQMSGTKSNKITIGDSVELHTRINKLIRQHKYSIGTRMTDAQLAEYVYSRGKKGKNDANRKQSKKDICMDCLEYYRCESIFGVILFVVGILFVLLSFFLDEPHCAWFLWIGSC